MDLRASAKRDLLANSKSQVLQQRHNNSKFHKNDNIKSNEILVSNEVDLLNDKPNFSPVKIPKYVKVSSKLPFDLNTLKTGKEYME